MQKTWSFGMADRRDEVIFRKSIWYCAISYTIKGDIILKYVKYNDKMYLFH